jgi:serine/threonine protein kinase
VSDTEKCPSEKMLIDFAAQTLNADDTVVVSEHLEECQTCADAVEWIKCHLLRPIDDDESELTGIGLNSPAEVDPISVSDGGEQNPQLVDFDFSSLEKSIVDGAIGRLGSYDILGIIGRGGMGVVFKAWDERLRRTVAIKVLKRGLACSTPSRRRFMREARAAAAISHPNVVTIHAVDEHRDTSFLVMEFISGHSLRAAIRGGSRLDFTTVLRISAQVASGLASAHAHGVIHRDIKPSNIMLEEKVDRAKITDFGLARAAFDNTDLTSCELAVGTPAYMSPEQVTGGAIDYRSDLFGLGCLFYEMVIGHSPFQGRNALDVARKVESHTPQPLHILQPSVPRFYSDVVVRLLEKEPDRRFQTAAEVADLLSCQLHSVNQMPSDHVPVLSADSPVAVAPKETIHRGRFSAITMSAALILAVIAVAGILFKYPGLLTKDLIAQNPAENAPDSSTSLVDGSALSTLEVSQSGGKPFSTIGAALRQAKAGSTILICDSAIYDETLILNDSRRWKGLTLQSPNHATLRSDSTETLLTIDTVSDVTISGLRMEAHTNQHGVEIKGECPGTKLQWLSVALPPQSQRAALYLNTAPAGTEKRPLVIEQSEFLANHSVAVIGDVRYPAAWIRFEGNRFQGHGAIRDGVGIVLHNSVRQLVAQNNVFYSIRRAVSIAPGDAGKLEGIEIRKNVVYACDHWLAITEPCLNGQLEITDNFLADVKGFQLSDEALDRNARRWFASNLWEIVETDAVVDRARAGKVANLCEHIPFFSRNPENAEFLKIANAASTNSSADQRSNVD